MLRDEVHVWHARLDELAPRATEFFGCLSEEERARGARFHGDRDRTEFSLTRGILRHVLASYGAGEASEIVIEYSARGKPRLGPKHRRQGIEFSVSHASGMAVYAVAQSRAIGVDVEQVREIAEMDRIVAQFFAVEEQTEYASLPLGARKQAFFNGWTRKEAFTKALGEGLAHPWDSFATTLGPGLPARFLRIGSDPIAAEQWMLADLAIDPSYVVALALQGPAMPVRSRIWPPRSPD